MKIAGVADIKAHFSAYLRAAARGPVVVTRSGKAVGVLLAVEDGEELERLVLAYSPRLRTILDAARRRLRAGAGIRHDDFWREMEGGGDSKQRRPVGEMATSAADSRLARPTGALETTARRPLRR